MVLNVEKYVGNGYTVENGRKVHDLLASQLSDNHFVTVSFSGIDAISSSFVNAAFISLLDTYSIDCIKSKINFVDSTKPINQMILKRFVFETQKRTSLNNAV